MSSGSAGQADWTRGGGRGASRQGNCLHTCGMCLGKETRCG